VFIFQKTVTDMKVSLKSHQNMGLVLRDTTMVRLMSANTRKIDQMVRVSIFGLMEVITKVNLLIIFVMVRDIIRLQMEVKFMKVNLEMTKNVD
jgi:hypothetical protein